MTPKRFLWTCLAEISDHQGNIKRVAVRFYASRLGMIIANDFK